MSSGLSCAQAIVVVITATRRREDLLIIRIQVLNKYIRLDDVEV